VKTTTEYVYQERSDVTTGGKWVTMHTTTSFIDMKQHWHDTPKDGLEARVLERVTEEYLLLHT